jgi:hypothetical protein
MRRRRRPRGRLFKVVKDPTPPARPVPLYVCPGARDEMLPYALFTFGDGLSRPVACPLRECCLWFAGHDLGGRDAITDFPEEAILNPSFRPHPFFCPHFREIEPEDPPEE